MNTYDNSREVEKIRRDSERLVKLKLEARSHANTMETIAIGDTPAAKALRQGERFLRELTK